MDIGAKALQVLKTVAPMLATAFGGPVGAIAYSAIAGALGIKDPKAIEPALLNATPDQLLNLKKADQEFAEKMKDLEIGEEKLAFDDTVNARARQVASKDSTPRNISYMLLGFTGIVIASEFLGWTKLEGTMAGTLIGYLVSETKSMMQYWFGTTKGSLDKDATISDIAKQP